MPAKDAEVPVLWGGYVLRPSTSAGGVNRFPGSRKMLQVAATTAGNTMSNTNRAKSMTGPYLVTPPFYAAGMSRAMDANSGNDVATERRFAMASAAAERAD
jgi:hypothetical protein